jgi:Protein of unknown function (DUF1501)
MTDVNYLSVAMNSRGVLSRRGFLRGVGLGVAGLPALSFTDLVAVRAEELRKRQMACILLWMTGGPSQFESFDPKPDHPNGGGTKVIETAAPGITIARGWEKTAAVMNDIAVIRSMTNKEGNHQRATYQVHTGYPPTGTVRHPSFGSLAAAEIGDPRSELPNYVTVGNAGGPGGFVGAGLLGPAYEPFQVLDPLQPPTNVRLPVAADRFERRLSLMPRLEAAGFARSGGGDQVSQHRTLYQQTARMVLSPKLQAFNLDEEPSSLRDAYGRNAFGQGCLLARRLVEIGVTFIEVRSGGWDTHQQNQERTATLARQTDPGLATLIGDLKRRGMLERTLVVWMGEFGRTPRINPAGGRDHFPRVFNALAAGGGVKGGQTIGASSNDGTDIKDNPVTVNDLLASLCHSLKINPAKENMSPQGRPIKIVDGGKVVQGLFA